MDTLTGDVPAPPLCVICGLPVDPRQSASGELNRHMDVKTCLRLVIAALACERRQNQLLQEKVLEAEQYIGNIIQLCDACRVENCI